MLNKTKDNNFKKNKPQYAGKNSTTQNTKPRKPNDNTTRKPAPKKPNENTPKPNNNIPTKTPQPLTENTPKRPQVPQKNDEIIVKITDLNNLGSGVGHYPEEGGVTVFVQGAVTGDLVKTKIIKSTKSYVVGKLLKVHERSKHRVNDKGLRNSECKAPASCGGCCYRNISYEYEIKVKCAYVRNAFKKVGLPNVEVDRVFYTGQVTGYRNKAQYPVRDTKEGIKAGFFASRTHNLIPSEDCDLQPMIFGDIVRFVLDFATQNGISAYDEETLVGTLRHIYIREGKVSGQIMVCLVINENTINCSDEFAHELQGKFPAVKSVMLNINEQNTNVILGKEFVCIGGVDYITDTLCGLTFKISAGSFYQVNHDAAEILYNLAKERAGLTGTETLLDLYCGTGTIGLSMAKYAKQVIGIEIVAEAIECAKENAKLNQIENAHFFCGDATGSEGLVKEAEKQLGKLSIDVIILDPPRKGCTRELIEYISRLDIKKVVYVSCDPDTLARDAKYFNELGYEVGVVTPVDMFPGTGHVECVVEMMRVEE